MSRTHQIIQHNSESSLSIADRLTDADRDHEKSTVQRQAVRRFVITMFFFFAITAWQSMPSLLQFFMKSHPRAQFSFEQNWYFILFILCTHLCLWHFDNSHFCCHPQGEYHLLWFILAARKLQSLLFKQSLFPHTNSFFAFSSSNIYGGSRIFLFFRRGVLPLRNEISDKWNRQFLYRILIVLEGCNSSRGEEGMCTLCYPSPDLPLCPKITHIFN